MNKSLNLEILEEQEHNSEIQSIPQNSQRNELFSAELSAQRKEDIMLRSFTPTRKPATLNQQHKTSANQNRIQQTALFEGQGKGKRQSMVAQIKNHINQLQSRVGKLEKKQARINKSRRIRRPSSQIAKLFMCPMEKCGKSYGTETAQKKHIQLKHPEQKIGEEKKAKE